ncbi:MAG: RidA family protein [Actinomycetes bacterium]
MPKQTVSTGNAAQPGGPYSQAVVAGDFVYLAGATPTHPDGTRETGDFTAQARVTLDNLAAVAEAAGASLDQAVRVGVYLRDLGNFPALNELFAQYFRGGPPARTTIPVDLPGIEIEVDAVLYRG